MRNRSDRFCFASGAGLAALGVVLGAFAAHALKARFGATELGWWETGVRYQMWSAVGLVALASVQGMRRGGVLVFAGTLVFSGSLYLMALTGVRALGAVTPIGGALMIAGWAIVAWKALRLD
ncbi:MAG TPA: DUF423 domain-containing protein [Allosphingosinicella sp.]|jgi:uncharacterized membrane protein YgdD (TMEM256/DUF423 family)